MHSCRLPDSASQGVVFRLRIYPRIRSQNRNGSKGSVRDLLTRFNPDPIRIRIQIRTTQPWLKCLPILQFFLYICPEEGVFRVFFSFKNTFRCIQTLNYNICILGHNLSQRMYPHLPYISLPVHGYPPFMLGRNLSQRRYPHLPYISPPVHGYPPCMLGHNLSHRMYPF